MPRNDGVFSTTTVEPGPRRPRPWITRALRVRTPDGAHDLTTCELALGVIATLPPVARAGDDRDGRARAATDAAATG